MKLKMRSYEPEISAKLCDGCGMCVAICPGETLSIKRVEGRLRASVVWSAKCSGCGSCEAICPRDAIYICSDSSMGVFVPLING